MRIKTKLLPASTDAIGFSEVEEEALVRYWTRVRLTAESMDPISEGSTASSESTAVDPKKEIRELASRFGEEQLQSVVREVEHSWTAPKSPITDPDRYFAELLVTYWAEVRLLTAIGNWAIQDPYLSTQAEERCVQAGEEIRCLAADLGENRVEELVRNVEDALLTDPDTRDYFEPRIIRESYEGRYPGIPTELEEIRAFFIQRAMNGEHVIGLPGRDAAGDERARS